jgi:hypothetical protein
MMNEIENRQPFNIELIDGIIHCIWCIEHYVIEDVEKGIELRIKIQQGKNYPMFVDFTNVKSGTREARQRLSDKDNGIGITAVAVLVKLKLQRILYNFFHSIYKAPAPTKLFTNKEEAIQWLQAYK